MSSSVSVREVENFFGTFPKTSDKNFVWNIFRKYEFQGKEATPDEKKPKSPGIPLSTQEFLMKYFSPHTNYTRGLLYHSMGTGKTCTTSMIAEGYKYLQNDNLVNGPPIVVLVPSSKLKTQFISDVAFQCTQPDVYEPERSKKEEIMDTLPSEQLYFKRTSRKVRKYYEISTHREIFNMKNRSLKKPLEYYKNKIIIVDEVHLITKKTEQDKKEKFDLYKEMHKFLHSVENCRIIIMTGTAIWDRKLDFFSLINLILPEKDNFPINEKKFKDEFEDSKTGNFTPEGEKEIKKRLRGFVSYLRPVSDIKKIEMGNVIPSYTEYTKLYTSVMSDYQSKLTQNLFQKTTKEPSKGSVYHNEIESSIFVFPGKGKPDLSRIGKVGWEKYGKDKFSLEIKKELRENLHKYSSIFPEIIKILNENPQEVSVIFSKYKNSGSGVLNIGKVLGLNGFENILYSGPMKTIYRRIKNKKNSDEDRRYAIISSSGRGVIKDGKSLRKFLNYFNSPENKEGKFCSVIILSGAGGTGLTIKNVRQYHIVTPPWNIPSQEQNIYRSIRVGTHENFPENERYLKIYRHISVTKRKNEETVGMFIYSVAEKKSIRDAATKRLVKEISFSCPAFYRKNVLKNDRPNTFDCDYQSCNYRCDNFPDKNIEKKRKDSDDLSVWGYTIPQNEILYNTFNIFFSQTDIKKICEKVVGIFGECWALDFDTLISKIEGVSSNLFLQSMDILINGRVKIRDPYGFPSYIREQENIYFLVSGVSDEGLYEENMYCQKPLVHTQLSQSKIFEKAKIKKDFFVINDYCTNFNVSKFSEMNYSSFVKIFEKAYEIFSSSKSNLQQKREIKKILDLVGKNFLILNQGQKNEIPIHILNSTNYTGKGYTPIINNSLIRTKAKKFVDGQWKNVFDENETDPDKKRKQRRIVKMINDKLKDISKEFDWDVYPLGFYGFLDNKGNFKIREKPKKGQRSTTGKACKSWQMKDLFGIIKKADIIPESSDNKSKQDLKKIVNAQPKLRDVFDAEKLSKSQMAGLIKLMSFSGNELCNYIQKKLKEINHFDVSMEGKLNVQDDDSKSNLFVYGVFKSQNSFLHCIFRALDINNYSKKLSVEKEKLIRDFKKNLRSDKKFWLCSQETYGMTEDQILEKLIGENYFDPNLFYKLVQHYFKVEIFVLGCDPNEGLIQPRYTQTELQTKTKYKKCIVVIRKKANNIFPYNFDLLSEYVEPDETSKNKNIVNFIFDSKTDVIKKLRKLRNEMYTSYQMIEPGTYKKYKPLVL